MTFDFIDRKHITRPFAPGVLVETEAPVCAACEGYECCTCDHCGGTGNNPDVIYGWIEPQDKSAVADYWLTRRSADAAPGYDIGSPDLRVKCRWNGKDAWIVGERMGRQRMEPILACKHGNNGWRIEGRSAT